MLTGQFNTCKMSGQIQATGNKAFLTGGIYFDIDELVFALHTGMNICKVLMYLVHGHLKINLKETNLSKMNLEKPYQS